MTEASKKYLRIARQVNETVKNLHAMLAERNRRWVALSHAEKDEIMGFKNKNGDDDDGIPEKK